ncbi:MAG: hypothetical protein FK734_11140 [Asgard group archaeon]|nr:hypothetical protein [Asgard group archaeon]
MKKSKISKKITTSSFIFLIISLIYTSNLVNDQKIVLISGCETYEETTLDVLWNKTYGGGYTHSGRSIIKSTSGGYVISGWTNGSGMGDLDVLLIGTTSDGSELWNKTIGDVEEDKGYQIINCQSGGFAVVSTYTNTSVAITNSDCMVTRLTNDGTIIWNKYYSGPEQIGNSYVGDMGRSIIQCTNGDFVVAGVTMTAIGNCDLWFFRITPSGIRLWDKTFHHWDIDRCFEPHSIVQCQSGGFAIVGYTYNTSQSNDVWLIRTDDNGNHLWNQTFGDAAGYQRPEALVECYDNGFAIVANTHSFGAGGADAWIIRTNQFGNQLWNNTYGGTLEDGCSYIMEMADNGFTLAGSTHSFDIGNGDAWLIKTDENGTIAWNFTIGTEFGNSAQAFVYEGNGIYTILGSTFSVGESFSKIWLFKIQVNTTIITITPSITTNNTEMAIVPILLPLIVVCYIKIAKKKK